MKRHYHKSRFIICIAIIILLLMSGCGGGGVSSSGDERASTGVVEETVTSDLDVTTNSVSTNGTAYTVPDNAGSGFNGPITLTWDPPVSDADGLPPTNLAGYKLYYGPSPGQYTNCIDVGNVTTYEIASLSVGAFYFAVTAYDTEGNESTYSNEINLVNYFAM